MPIQKSAPGSDNHISDAMIDDICQRLRDNKSVRRTLPGGGLLSLDRALPFLCVYRRDPQFADLGTRDFASHEAAYLQAPGDAPVREGLGRLVRRVVAECSERFGAFLLLELRASDTVVAQPKDQPLARPSFTIHATRHHHPSEALHALHFGLDRLALHRQTSEVKVHLNSHIHPPGLKPLLTTKQADACKCSLFGLEIAAIYRDSVRNELFPEVLDELRRKLSTVLKKTFFSFAVHQTNLRPHHYYALGRKRVQTQVWDVDRQLSEIDSQMDILLLVTPVNAKAARDQFKRSGFRESPHFEYHPLPFDPLIKKRELTNIQTERIEDPTLEFLFRRTQDDIDRQITMLSDIGTRRFMSGSVQVFGDVEPELKQLAEQLLAMPPEPDDNKESLGPVAFAHRAEKEIKRYRKLDPTFAATVEVRDDMYSGLMVSGTRLLVGRETHVPTDRADALLAHEIGTHLVTRHNGARQPMRLLQTGLAGYDSLQEGLAVMSEFLVGGLSLSRLRLLAARVVAVDSLIRGDEFRETFDLLHRTHGLDWEVAYTVTLRVFRGGGLTKDAAYLRGFQQVSDFVSGGGDLKILFVGKLASEHIPLVRELIERAVLKPASIVPPFLTRADCVARLETVKEFESVVELAGVL